MRPSCLSCTIKHLAQAHVLMEEARQGYPQHRWLAIGHLAEASSEVMATDQQLADEIRTHRKNYEQKTEYKVPIMALLDRATSLDTALKSTEAVQPPEPIIERVEEAHGGPLPENIRERLSGPRTQKTEQKKPKRNQLSLYDAACRSCGPAKAWEQLHSNATKGLPRVIIMTTFASCDDSYSLSNVVIEQARAALTADFAVSLWALMAFDVKTLPEDLATNRRFIVRPVLPVWTWEEDTIKEEAIPHITTAIHTTLAKEGQGVILAHDLIFQSWFVTYAKALHVLGETPGWQWFHVIHSTPGDPITEGDSQWRSKLPDGHQLIALNKTNVTQLAHSYQTDIQKLHYMPNSKHLGSFYSFDPLVEQVLEDTGLMEADIAQVYPISATRIADKGTHDLVHLFAEFNKGGLDARLLLVDAHSTDDRAVAQRKMIVSLAEEGGMSDKLFWSSDWLTGTDAKYKGITQQQVAQLLLASNLFIFPSRSEACPLVQLEAALAGCLLVLNSAVPSMGDLTDKGNAIWINFGTEIDQHTYDNEKTADTIVEALQRDRALGAKREILKHHNRKAWGQQLHKLAEGHLRVPVSSLE